MDSLLFRRCYRSGIGQLYDIVFLEGYITNVHAIYRQLESVTLHVVQSKVDVNEAETIRPDVVRIGLFLLIYINVQFLAILLAVYI